MSESTPANAAAAVTTAAQSPDAGEAAQPAPAPAQNDGVTALQTFLTGTQLQHDEAASLWAFLANGMPPEAPRGTAGNLRFAGELEDLGFQFPAGNDTDAMYWGMIREAERLQYCLVRTQEQVKRCTNL